MNHCSGDLTAMKIKSSSEEGLREIILGLAYLPFDDVEPPPTRELERMVTWCRAEGTHLIIGCDANSHRISLGSTNINNRDESLFNYIMANGLRISGSLSPRHGASSGCRWRKVLRYGG
jgi:hypothetical protein